MKNLSAKILNRKSLTTNKNLAYMKQVHLPKIYNFTSRRIFYPFHLAPLFRSLKDNTSMKNNDEILETKTEPFPKIINKIIKYLPIWYLKNKFNLLLICSMVSLVVF
jgi:hypothetical protein